MKNFFPLRRRNTLLAGPLLFLSGALLSYCTPGTAPVPWTKSDTNIRSLLPEKAVLLASSLPSSGRRDAFGDASLLERRFTPASTFKILIALAGLRSTGVDPDFTCRVKDLHVPGSPRSLDMHQALFYSSNDYFVRLAELVGRESLVKLIPSTRFTTDPIPSSWPGKDFKDVVHAGSLTVSPVEAHDFMLRLAEGELHRSPSLQGKLLEVMEWPSPLPDVRVYGKTGSAEDALWFNGFALHLPTGRKRVVTLLWNASYTRERRSRVMELFYRALGLSWSDSLAKRLDYSPGEVSPRCR